jgi:very-short-patch-repair endonuclease
MRIAVTAPRTRRGPLELEIHRSRTIASADRDRVHEIPVTSVPRTLLDLAGILDPHHLPRVLDRAERLDLFDLTAVEEVLLRANGRRGAGALRRAIAAWRPRDTRSELEYRFLDLIQSTSLPSPAINVLVQGAESIHEVDAHWPSHNLVVELDGFAYHRTRRDLERDAGKDADLELAGYRVMRLTWDEITRHEARTRRRLSLLLSDT